ncbi:hypothetical protein [Ramlibacter sp. PS4R-6]|uniref:hypothetical protein n=1 Tax=Ramlibacter sp. PS4R-6 TaxID=3133438 RepID=UPI0030AE18D1
MVIDDQVAAAAAHRHALGRLRARVNFGLGLLLLGAGAINAGAHVLTKEAERGSMHLAAAAFCVYLFLECRRHTLRTDAFGLLAPPLLASVLFAFLSFVFPVTASLHDPYIAFRFDGVIFGTADEISEVLGMLALACFCLWRGYGLGSGFARRLGARIQRAALLRQEWAPRMPALLVLQAIFIGLAIASINLGVFGMASSPEARERNVLFLDIINVGMTGGTVSLLLLLIVYFRRADAGRKHLGLGILCALLIMIHLAFGLLSGFKFQLVTPFITIVIAQYLASRKVSTTFVAMGIAALVLAYSVVEPYRAYLTFAGLRGESELHTLARAVGSSISERTSLARDDHPLSTQIATRFDLTLMTAVGLQAAQEKIVDERLIGEMAESIYLSPILAFVPRLFWQDKGSYATGAWFYQIAMGGSSLDNTSVGMGPIAYLYFIGGVLGIVLGFVAIGVLQAIVFEGIARVGAGGVLIYLSTIATLVLLPSDIGPALTGMLRMLVIAFVAQLILLRPNRQGAGAWSRFVRKA